MKIPSLIKIYGDILYRGKCPNESLEIVTFFNRIRKLYPDSYGLLAYHPRNEGKRTYQQTIKYKSEGMVTGTADIVIVGNPSFVCELKRRDPTLSSISDEQINYLLAAQNHGSFVCVALGHEAAWEAFNEWRKLNDENKRKDTE